MILVNFLYLEFILLLLLENTIKHFQIFLKLIKYVLSWFYQFKQLAQFSLGFSLFSYYLSSPRYILVYSFGDSDMLLV